MTANKTGNAALQRAIKDAGGPQQLAEKLGVTRPAILWWQSHQVPAERLIELEQKTGISRAEFRPDLYTFVKRGTAWSG